MEPLIDLYDVAPHVIRLVGSCYDGQRVTIDQRDWPLRWLMPGPPPELTLESYCGSQVTRHLAYDYTDQMNDRGERVYRFVGEY